MFFFSKSKSHGIRALNDAVDVGYRHFDTAFAYTNEKEVGQAIRENISKGVIKREDVFVTTKVRWIFIVLFTKP